MDPDGPPTSLNGCKSEDYEVLVSVHLKFKSKTQLIYLLEASIEFQLTLTGCGTGHAENVLSS